MGSIISWNKRSHFCVKEKALQLSAWTILATVDAFPPGHSEAGAAAETIHGNTEEDGTRVLPPGGTGMTETSHRAGSLQDT